MARRKMKLWIAKVKDYRTSDESEERRLVISATSWNKAQKAAREFCDILEPELITTHHYISVTRMTKPDGESCYLYARGVPTSNEMCPGGI